MEENIPILEQLRAAVVKQGWSLRIKKCWGKEYVFATKGGGLDKEQRCFGLLENLESKGALERAGRLSLSFLAFYGIPDIPRDYFVFFRNDGSAKPASWRKALVKMFSDACMCCGWNLAPCDAHHILPKSQGGTQTLENGVLLCPNCHRLADLGLLSSDELRHVRDTAIPRRPHWRCPDTLLQSVDTDGGSEEHSS